MKLSGCLRLVLLLSLILLVIKVVAHEAPQSLKRVYQNMLEHRFALNNTNNKALQKYEDNELENKRTFGHKRIQFMIMPMIYKMGVMMTMLVILTIISLKSFIIGVVLLILKLSSIFGKIFSKTHEYSFGASTPPHQPIHLHLHNTDLYETNSNSYGGWETAGGGSHHENYYYKG